MVAESEVSSFVAYPLGNLVGSLTCALLSRWRDGASEASASTPLSIGAMTRETVTYLP